MSARPKKTVVLTSRENFVWLSMQEIIPLIERNWLQSALPGKHEVRCLNVDELPIADLMTELLSADNVVFTCFTVKLSRIGELLRKSFGIEARYFIYLHNQATILCWPFHVWGMGSALRQDDVFISTSTADAETFSHSFKNARVEVIPFTIAGIKPSYPIPKREKTRVPFVYAGRLSVQKNIHTLVYTFRMLRDERPELSWHLSIYGKDDDLGSPNMGMASSRYGESLKELSRALGLESQVSFLGYQKRENLNRTLSATRHVAVSASLHSDENFGMAQFRSLSRGNLAVLTCWGGYADFGKHFRDRAFLAKVEESEKGPWVDPKNLARLLAQAAEAYGKSMPDVAEVPRYYWETGITARLRGLALESPRRGPSLKMTALAERILRKQASFDEGKPGSSQIFESYADPDARVAFRGYRMGPSKDQGSPKNLRCFPWVQLSRGKIDVRDPHRGSFELGLSFGDVVLTDWSGACTLVDRKTASRLLSLGYAGRES